MAVLLLSRLMEEGRRKGVKFKKSLGKSRVSNFGDDLEIVKLTNYLNDSGIMNK